MNCMAEKSNLKYIRAIHPSWTTTRKNPSGLQWDWILLGIMDLCLYHWESWAKKAITVEYSGYECLHGNSCHHDQYRRRRHWNCCCDFLGSLIPSPRRVPRYECWRILHSSSSILSLPLAGLEWHGYIQQRSRLYVSVPGPIPSLLAPTGSSISWVCSYLPTKCAW